MQTDSEKAFLSDELIQKLKSSQEHTQIAKPAYLFVSVDHAFDKASGVGKGAAITAYVEGSKLIINGIETVNYVGYPPQPLQSAMLLLFEKNYNDIRDRTLLKDVSILYIVENNTPFLLSILPKNANTAVLCENESKSGFHTTPASLLRNSDILRFKINAGDLCYDTEVVDEEKRLVLEEQMKNMKESTEPQFDGSVIHKINIDGSVMLSALLMLVGASNAFTRRSLRVDYEAIDV